MPLLVSVPYVTVSGTVESVDKTPMTGWVEVIPVVDGWIRDQQDNGIVEPVARRWPIAVDGTFTIGPLMVNDDPQITPQGWPYRVIIRARKASEPAGLMTRPVEHLIYVTSADAAFTQPVGFASLL